MCTAISYRPQDHYFGRTLDVDRSFQEEVVITPRNYPLTFRSGMPFRNRYALIGMAAVAEDLPCYFDAANEKGLAMAGLNFPGNAVYRPQQPDQINVTPGEFFLWILGQAATVREARALLERTNLCRFPQQPVSPLHFMLSDREGSIVAEPREEGFRIYDNPFDVMTNNPPFDYHLQNLRGYLNLSPKNSENRFSRRYPLENYGVGMGAIGLPGDASSASRFVRAAFHLANSHSEGGEEAHVSQFFHVLDAVSMVKGSTLTDQGADDFTLYTCCINTDQGIYYYRTYDNQQLTAIRLSQADLDVPVLHRYDLVRRQQIRFGN